MTRTYNKETGYYENDPLRGAPKQPTSTQQVAKLEAQVSKLASTLNEVSQCKSITEVRKILAG
jgi:hypothetical protein